MLKQLITMVWSRNYGVVKKLSRFALATMEFLVFR